MDSEEYSTTYLKYLNDNTNNYLLNNGEVGLNELSIEPMFTEIDASDWHPEGLPLLLSNSLITEGKAILYEINTRNIKMYSTILVPEAIHNPEPAKSAKCGQISLLKSSQNKNTAPLENVYLTNEFVINASSEDGAEYVYATNDCNLNANNEADPKETIYLNNLVLQDIGHVQIINTGETIQANVINDETNNVEQLTEENPEKPEYFTTVQAQKCSFCGFLCETTENIKLHLKEQHSISVY